MTSWRLVHGCVDWGVCGFRLHLFGREAARLELRRRIPDVTEHVGFEADGAHVRRRVPTETQRRQLKPRPEQLRRREADVTQRLSGDQCE